MKIEALKYYGWKDLEQMSKSFDTKDCYNYEIIFASNIQESYEGYAYVLCKQGSQLFEVEASHCSCHGFEDQWKPTKITKEYLVNRFTDQYTGYMSNSDSYEAFKLALKIEGIE